MLSVDVNYAFICSDSPFVAQGDDGLTFRKEVIYEGKFVKASDDQEFEVKASDIDHWVKTGNLMLANGIDIPWPVEHTTDPEKTRALSQRFEKGVNDDGLNALYVVTKFADADAAKLALTSDVSVFVPPVFTDGKGRTYPRPIRHIALTNYPVIPNLGGFETIAASLSSGESKMPLKELAASLGVKGDDDAALSKGIGELVASLQKELKTLKAAADTGGGGGGGNEEEEEEKKKIAASLVSPAHVTMLRDNRQLKLSQLVTEGKITPAQSKQLKEQYCTDQGLTLSLNGTDDGFDGVFTALSMNEPMVTSSGNSGDSGPQALRLSGAEINDEKKNPLLKDAASRK